MNSMISVIVPVYNVEKVVGRCIESICNQTYKNIEVILVDDGSKDNSGKICEQYAAEDRRINVIHKKNAGVSEARNDGLAIAKGEFISFVDSDDYLEPLYIETLMKYMVEEVDFVGSSANIIDDCGRSAGDRRYKDLPVCAEVTDENVRNNLVFFLHVIEKLFRRSVLEGLRFKSDLFVGEDSVFCLQAVLKSRKISLVDLKMYNYVIYPISAYHGVIDHKKLTELDAWNIIINAMPNYPQTQRRCKEILAGKCLELCNRIDSSDSNKTTYYKKIQRVARELYPIVISRRDSIWNKIRFTILCLSGHAFCLLKNIYGVIKK